MLVVVPDDYPAVFGSSTHSARLRKLADLRVYESLPDGEDDLAARMAGAAAVLNMRAYSHFSEAVIRRCPELELISVSGTGTDHIDLEAAAACGVLVCNTPEANSISVAEHTWALILALSRGLRQMEDRMRAGEWQHHFGMELHGKNLGLVGLGRIGRHVARIGRGFGMRLLGWSPSLDPERAEAEGVELHPFPELLSQSHVVSLHLRLSERSRGIIGASEIASLRPDALLVNTARGALIDEEALAAALEAGRLGGAALDCYSQEPLPLDHPLRRAPRTLLIPHAGWMTREARERMLGDPVDNIAAWLDGRPRNLVETFGGGERARRQNR